MNSSTLKIDGVDVHIEGNNGAEAIVMVHGWPDTHRLWDEQVAQLRARYRCVRFTWPGFDGARPRRGHSLDELVRLLQRIVEQACPGEAVTLLLHDWGCVFGYQFAMQHPQLVRRIVGVDVGDAGSPAHRAARRLRENGMVFAYQAWLVLAWRIDQAFGGTLGDRMTRAMARWAGCRADPQRINAGMCYPYDIAWTGSHGGYRHALPLNPRVPMLYLYGRRKPFQFQSNQWLHALRAMPGSQAIEFDTGHWLMKSKPREFNAALEAWLAASAG
jgi:pimeloyl-ACP methyl ester carboxylesterase